MAFVSAPPVESLISCGTASPACSAPRKTARPEFQILRRPAENLVTESPHLGDVVNDPIVAPAHRQKMAKVTPTAALCERCACPALSQPSLQPPLTPRWHSIAASTARESTRSRSARLQHQSAGRPNRFLSDVPDQSLTTAYCCR